MAFLVSIARIFAAGLGSVASAEGELSANRVIARWK